MRYRFYREHKFVSAALNSLERLIAQTDFCDDSALDTVRTSFHELAGMLINHANYENERIHRLLREKNSPLYGHVEKDHDLQTQQLSSLADDIEQIALEPQDAKKIELGFAFYLTYRKFVADNLLHLHEEETIILPELQRLYTDAELMAVPAIAYREMQPEHITHMLEGLFPHMNKHDRRAFLEAIKILEPEKLAEAWPSICELLNEREQEEFGELVSRT